ncbi:MAG: thiamine-phosphate kinase [Myxococcota bacterium]
MARPHSRPRRTLADLGESALIARIARRAGHPTEKRWSLAIGDDAALLKTRAGEELVVSTDAQVEGVHFLFEREGPRRVGRRAAIVNISDLAAMGATPVGLLMSLCAPPEMELADFDALVGGFVEEAKRYACPLVGGNLSRAEKCSVHVTVIGRCAQGKALRRGQVRPGDGLYVTGTLGRGALARLEADAGQTPLRYVPAARLEAGQALARMPEAAGCIDLSDGLATDLGQLLGDSGFGAAIEARRLPAPRGFSQGCEGLGLDPVEVQTRGGEDYELLFALRPRRNSRKGAPGAAAGGGFPKISTLARRLGVSVTRIGEVVEEEGIQGLPIAASRHHF